MEVVLPSRTVSVAVLDSRAVLASRTNMMMITAA